MNGTQFRNIVHDNSGGVSPLGHNKLYFTQTSLLVPGYPGRLGKLIYVV
jgi:hypothetical protein